MQVSCEHWSDSPEFFKGLCALSLYGGQPTYGQCVDLCEKSPSDRTELEAHMAAMDGSPSRQPLSDTQKAAYWAICQECEKYETCRRCETCQGNTVYLKPQYADETCPDDKWRVGGMVSVLLATLDEPHLQRTIDDLEAKARGEIEIIALEDHQREGRRLLLNRAARQSRGEFLFVLDAHCIMSEGWDEELKAVCTEQDLVVCRIDGIREDSWQPAGHKYDFVMIDADLRDKWWGLYAKRLGDGPVQETMGFTGCGWMIRKAHWDKLGGFEEDWAGYGACGTEWSLKVWLSGGRCLLHRGVTCAHLFRQKATHAVTPHEIDQTWVKLRRMFHSGNGPSQCRSIDWLVEKFAPVPSWEAVTPQQAQGKTLPSAAVVYYSHNNLDTKIADTCRAQLVKAVGDIPIVAVTHKAIPVGAKHQNICVGPMKAGHVTLLNQIMMGIYATDAEVIFLAEHDVLYPESHFQLRPTRAATIAYDTNVVCLTPRGYLSAPRPTLSGLIAHRGVLLSAIQAMLVQLSHGDKLSRLEPVDQIERLSGEQSLLDIRHGKNFTGMRGDEKSEYSYTDKHWGSVMAWWTKLGLQKMKEGT